MTNSKNIPSTYRKLVRLEKLDDYQVHHDDVDIRDFKVKTSDEQTIGEVENLIVDEIDKIVRYAEIELDDKIASLTVPVENVKSYTEKDGDRMIIVPIGMVSIHDKHVHVDGLTAAHFGIYPRYKKMEELTSDYETSVFNYITGPLENPKKAEFDRTDEATGSAIVFNKRFYGSPYFQGRKYKASGLQTDMTKSI